MSFIASLLASSDDGGGGAAAVILVIYFAVIILVIAGMWKTFTKAGEDGWKAIIPIYNVWVLLRIVGRPGWWLILFLIPFVNFVIWIIVANDLSKSYGRGVGFTLGLIFLSPIFILILGFGGARYVGPGGTPAMSASGAAPPPAAGGTPPPPPATGGTPPPPPPPPG